VGIIVKGELKTVVNISELMTKGIEGYTVIFSKISETMKQTLRRFGAKEREGLRFEINKDMLPGLLATLKEDASKIQFIEPLRKGLESLFREIVYEET
jgi:hypothetical protein